MCQFSSGSPFGQMANGDVICPAKALDPSQRMQIAIQAISGAESITNLADEFDVSRKFVAGQADKARAALDEAFAPAGPSDDEVLYSIPVTKSWRNQVVLALTLIGRGSFRGVIEFCRDILDFKISIGTVHNIVHAAVDTARSFNLGQNLGNIEFAGLDEIFQNDQPILVGADIRSTYCFLLSPEEHRDADTWGVHLLDLLQRHFAPKATIADFAAGIRAGQALAMPGLPCRGDIFHVEMEITPVVCLLDNQAYKSIETREKLQKNIAKIERKLAEGQTAGATISPQLVEQFTHATQAEATAIALVDDIRVLSNWLQRDIFAVSGMPYEKRCELYDFICAELQTRESLCPHRIGPLVTLLNRRRDELLAFAKQLESDLGAIAIEFGVDPSIVCQLLDVEATNERSSRRWHQDALLRRKLGYLYYDLSVAVRDLKDNVVRASSVVENLNSRLRTYFTLRRELGPDYLALLQFFLNHRRFMRSDRPERVNKSPTELLTGKPHAHWLELLGYQRFSRA